MTGGAAGPGAGARGRRGGRPVVVISAAAARRFWPDGWFLGRFVRMGAQPGPGDDSVQGEIVGVAGDVRERGLDREPRPIIYADLAQMPGSGVTIAIRTSVTPLSLAPELRRILAALDPQL